MMTEERGADWRLAAFLCSIAAGIALLLFLFIYPPVWSAGFWTGVNGGKGAIELIINAGTLFAVVGGAYLAFKSYQMNRATALATRFQKGAELLSNNEPVAKASGIIVLSELAVESPFEFAAIVLELMIEFVNVSGNETWQETPPIEGGTAPGIFPILAKARPPHHKAFDAIGSLLTESGLQDARVRINSRNALRLQRTSLTAIAVGKRNFADFMFLQVDFAHGRFDDCSLRSSRFVACGMDRTEFWACDLTGTTMSANKGSTIELVGCDLRNATIRGDINLEIDICDLSGARLSIGSVEAGDCWFFERPPKISFTTGQRVRVYDAQGPGRTESGKFVPETGSRYFEYSKGAPLGIPQVLG